jgi:glycosyltransferase involved in cell wall biosynthesis
MTKASNKITFVSFQEIRNGMPLGMVKVILPILQYIDSFRKGKHIYIVGRKSGLEENDNIQEVGKLYSFLIRLLLGVNHYILGISSFRIRLLQERLFDYFVSRRIKEPTILISTTYLRRTTKKNKELGGCNIFIAGNPDDFEINKLLQKEQIKHSVIVKDAYTYAARINFIVKSLNSFDHIACLTISEYESFLKRISPEKLSLSEYHIIPNLNVFANENIKKESKLTFCYVAHPFWLKGLPYLLEAWKRTQLNNCQLRIGGKLDEQLKDFINRNYADLDNVEYLGWIDDLNHFMRSSHVCVVPSLLDGGPATVAEAMYCGLPVIVSDGCGARTLVEDKVNGGIITAGDSDAIIEKMKWFYQNQESIENMGQNAINKVIKLTKNDQNRIITDHLFSVINNLLESDK